MKRAEPFLAMPCRATPRLLLLNQIDAVDFAVVVFVADTFTLTRGAGDGSVAHCTAAESGIDHSR